ncbi:MAG: DNA translocase FtsK, partial [Ruminococcaceae bacterium]|nr:DNA translocase FtsK [Oscillospiraceae bacterium]
MAATRKKTSGNRQADTGKKRGRPATAQKKSTRASGQSKQPPAKRPIRREVWSAVCLVLALFSALGYFSIEGLFIDYFCGLLKGLIGWGFFLVAPVLLLAFYILAFHRGRPVRLRLTCALLLPVLLGTGLHLFLAQEYTWSGALVGQLWSSGREFASGGIVSGVLAIGGKQLFSVPGTLILLIVAAFFMGLAAFNRGIGDIVDYIRNRPHPEYEPPVEEPEKPKRQTVSEPVQEKAPLKRTVFDIPLDDGPVTAAPEKVPNNALSEPKPQKSGFFNRKPNVKAPDEVLTGVSHIVDEPLEPFKEPVPAPVPEVEAPAVPEIVREPAVPKVTASEAAQAAQEVAKDIEQTMEQESKPYQYPPLSLLNESGVDSGVDAQSELNINRQRLNDTIRSFGIEANIINIVRGPSVTRYELELDQGVRLNKLTNLADDIALALGATGVRIAPIPDKISVVGIEVPNKAVSPVSIHEVIGSKNFTDSKSKVSFAVGKDIGGRCVVGDISKLPHLLIAGTTGSGKSVCTNSIITSLLYKATPEEVRLIMVDPKMVELGIYNGIPHLLIPVVTDPKKAAGALQWAVTEMMKRYRTFSEVGVRKLDEYNALAAKTEGMEKMPSVVVLIDELADLMLVAAKEVEESICRVAQMGRASGMHLVIATQRPSADVITGLMKANIPSRIAFAVASAMESRIILDTMGAEKLVGRGDMLFAPLGSGKPQRVQGCFISDEEVARVVEFVKKSGSANYS